MNDKESEKVAFLSDHSPPSSPRAKYNSTLASTSQAELGNYEATSKLPNLHNFKKKQPPFLDREITIINSEDVDDLGLLKSMNERFIKGFKHWVKRAKIFKLAHFTVTMVVITLQLSQVILFQLPISSETKHIFATVLPAVTGAVLAMQLKLAWTEKGTKCKKSAKLYRMLAEHTQFRLEMYEAGGRSTDVDTIKLWNVAMLAEIKEAPAFVMSY